MLGGRKCPLQKKKERKLELDNLLQFCAQVILTKYTKWVYMLKKLPHTSFFAAGHAYLSRLRACTVKNVSAQA